MSYCKKCSAPIGYTHEVRVGMCTYCQDKVQAHDYASDVNDFSNETKAHAKQIDRVTKRMPPHYGISSLRSDHYHTDSDNARYEAGFGGEDNY